MPPDVIMAYRFEPNWKCVWITVAVAAGYWYLPHRNPMVLVALLWLPYVAIAWYDHVYGCDRRLKPTLFPFGRTIFLPFKPDSYKADFDSLPPEAIRAMDQVDHVAGWTLLVGSVAATWWALGR